MLRILEARLAGRLLKRKAVRLAEAEAVVRPILEAVRTRGDRALIEYGRRFDGLDARSVAVPQSVCEAAAARLSREFRSAVALASRNIRAFARLQLPVARASQPSAGLRLGQIIRPLDTVGAYIPSGRYPLPSTVMMTVIPAQVAGVPNVCVTSPRLVDEILGTAWMLGVRQVFRMGGAHAIAAFAYGTRTVPRADRIVGPGNIYVAAAKKLLAGETGIDFVAGPTEILIVAEEGDPRWLAADMLAQAEHDTDASAILLTTSRPLAEAVRTEVTRQLQTLPRPMWRASPSATIAPSFSPVPRRKRSNWRIASRRSILRFPTPRCSSRCATPVASSSAITRRKRPATMPAVPITCCPHRVPRGCAADCRRRISSR